MTAVRFDLGRQREFADLSGDHNPLHVDETEARRSQFGACVVHGVHLVLCALDSIDVEASSRLLRLDAVFRSAVLVGESANFEPSTRADGSIVVQVVVGSQVRSTITCTIAPLAGVDVRTRAAAVTSRELWPTSGVAVRGLDSLAGVDGIERLAMNTDTWSRMFPSVARWLDPVDAAFVLASTRVVGMKAPGQWALFRRLVIEAGEDTDTTFDDRIDFRVTAIDARFSMVSLVLEHGPRRGRAEVIVRVPPPEQVGLDEVRRRVPVGAFAGTTAVVIGGSRGLGELTAKVLAAGGAEVAITYRSGAADADRVVRELGGSARSFEFDADDPDSRGLAAITKMRPTMVAYFATPVIAKQPPGRFDVDVYRRFTSVYLDGFVRVLAAANAGGALDKVFAPSSSFVDDAPTGFAEYRAAKLALESLADGWSRTHPSQKVVVPRLPPLLTDQTVARLGSVEVDNLGVLLPAVRELFG